MRSGGAEVGAPESAKLFATRMAEYTQNRYVVRVYPAGQRAKSSRGPLSLIPVHALF
jgi:hypothetical protein